VKTEGKTAEVLLTLGTESLKVSTRLSCRVTATYFLSAITSLKLLFTSSLTTSQQEQKAVVSLTQPSQVAITMKDDPSSPLKSFNLSWELQEVSPSQCKVQLSVSYDFKSALHRMLAGSTFDDIQAGLIPEFEKRCKKIFQKE
jgi:ribosome-associated toxin RatA of RatAB toxin-antitoxin module